MATATLTANKTNYAPGETMVLTVLAEGDAGFTRVLVFTGRVAFDGVEITTPPLSVNVGEPADVILVKSVVCDDPAVVPVKDTANQFVWRAVAPAA